MDKEMKVIDIFAGAGGFSKGFSNAGFSIVDFAEFDINAIDTYVSNIKIFNDFVDESNPSKNVVDMFDPKQVKNFISRNENNELDVLIGGFPCQGYSLIGKRNIKDERNTLFRPTLKIIDELNPKFFVLENVPGILSLNKGRDVKEIISFLNKKGWYVRWEVLDSSKLGVPQKRKRVFFIGSKLNLKDSVDSIWDDLLKINKAKLTVGHSIEKYSKQKKFLNHELTKHTEKVLLRISKLSEGEPLYKNFAGGTKRLFWNEPSPTIRDNHGGTFIHPKEDRYLTAREIASLQTFPDNYEFKGPKTRQLKQIGNAVPVKMAWEIAKKIKEKI